MEPKICSWQVPSDLHTAIISTNIQGGGDQSSEQFENIRKLPILLIVQGKFGGHIATTYLMVDNKGFQVWVFWRISLIMDIG